MTKLNSLTAQTEFAKNWAQKPLFFNLIVGISNFYKAEHEFLCPGTSVIEKTEKPNFVSWAL